MSEMLLPLDENPFPGIVFVDCEASALERPSYPIEVGIAWCDGRSEGHLVRPAEEWDDWIWSLASSEVHKIPRGDLFRHGKDVEWHADWLNRELEGKVVCSDNPHFEAYWLSQLFRAAGVKPRFAFADAHDLVCSALLNSSGSIEPYEALRASVLSRHPITHRAADDALFWATLFREANGGSSAAEASYGAGPVKEGSR